MARVNNLTNFLNDVATAIKTKLGDNTSIPAAEFDSKIMEIETAGNYQNKSITITTNGNYNLLPDTGFDAMDQVSISVNVPVDGVQVFETEQAMKNTGLSIGDKAIVYNTTDKLVGYYDTIQGETVVQFPLANNYTITNDNITYNFNNCKKVDKQKLIRIMHKLCSELGWDYSFGWGNPVENASVVYKNNKWYAYASWFNGTWPSPRKQHYNIYMLTDGQSYNCMCYDNPTSDTPSQRLEYCELDLENETYEYLGIPTYDSIVPYNVVSSSSTTAYQSVQFTLSNNDTIALAYFNGANGPNFQLPPILKNILDGSDIPSETPSYTKTQTGETAMDTTEIIQSLLDTGLIYGTQDADATANDILLNKIAYVNGVKLVGTYEGSSDFNAKMLTSIADTTADLSKYIVNIPVLDTSNIRNMNSTFYGCSALTEVPLLNTSNVTTMNSTFYGCSLLTSIPLFITSNVTSMSNIFKNCTSLVDVPVFDTSALINMTNMFSSCPNLSNNSLNNILTMCINASSFNGVKTLKTLGLTSAQATTCQSLENYQDFIDAGWTTGY